MLDYLIHSLHYYDHTHTHTSTCPHKYDRHYDIYVIIEFMLIDMYKQCYLTSLECSVRTHQCLSSDDQNYYHTDMHTYYSKNDI